MNNYDSFLEIAVSLMKKKKKPQTLDLITKEVFSKKGVEGSELQIAQFQVDFMLSGYFVCCAEDKDGVQLWDLKTRQPSSLLDKEGVYMKDMSDEDEEVLNNELKDDYQFDGRQDIDQYIDDDDEETTEQDDIEEDLGIVALSQDPDESDEVITYEGEDEEEDDFDDIEEELTK